MRRVSILTLALCLVGAACGDDEAAPTTEVLATTTAATTATSIAVTTIAPPPTTEPEGVPLDPMPEVPLFAVTEAVAAAFGNTVSCTPMSGGAVGPGSVVTCVPDPVPTEEQFPVITSLVLDETGLVTSGLGGLYNFALNPELVQSEVPSGLNCTDLLAADSAFSTMAADLTNEALYFGTVLYWFLEGRPAPLMDIDENGRPCESMFEAEVVDSVLAGGLFGEPSEPTGLVAADFVGVEKNGDLPGFELLQGQCAGRNYDCGHGFEVYVPEGLLGPAGHADGVVEFLGLLEESQGDGWVVLDAAVILAEGDGQLITAACFMSGSDIPAVGVWNYPTEVLGAFMWNVDLGSVGVVGGWAVDCMDPADNE